MGADTGKIEPKEAAFALNNRVLRMPDLSEAEVTDEGGGRGCVVGWDLLKKLCLTPLRPLASNNFGSR